MQAAPEIGSLKVAYAASQEVEWVSDETGGRSAQRLLLALAALAPPAAVLTAFGQAVKENTGIAIIVLIGYEIALLILGFIGAIITDAQARWAKSFRTS